MPAQVEAKIVNLPQFKEKLRHLKAEARGEPLAKAAHAGAFQLIGYIKVNITEAPLVDTGNLRASVTEDEFHSEALRVWVTLGPHTVYARIHEFGGIIRPTKALLLHWVDKAGVDHYAKAVQIPARPYIRPAIDEHGDDVGLAIAAVLGPALEAAFGKGGGYK